LDTSENQDTKRQIDHMNYKRLSALFIFSIFFIQASVSAQVHGTITYEETIKLNIELPPEMADMAAQFPSVQQNEMNLYFADSQSLFMNAPADEDEEEEHDHYSSSSEGMTINFRMDRPENKSFVDRDLGTTTRKEKFFGKTFLIKGEHEPKRWKIESGTQSEFLGFTCQKAIMVDDSVKVEAWFTSEIPVSVGPSVYGDLPGAILVLTIDDGERSFVATNYDDSPLEEGTLTKPTKGKKVSKEEFAAIQEEKIKEMGMMQGGSGEKGTTKIVIMN